MISSRIHKCFILGILIIIITTPFILREKGESVFLNNDTDTLVILTPHNESLRYEYTTGFKKWYKAKTGKEINIDWRYQGGGQETARYIESMFSNNFRDYWIHTLKKPWSNDHATAFANRNVNHLDQSECLLNDITKEFINSNIGCGIDLLFGGGFYEFILQSNKGNIVPCNILYEHPEMFSDDTIPEFFAGCRLWDAQGKWFGASLSAFGIIYNKDALISDGITHPPIVWSDLATPEYFRKLAVVDPTKSSSMLKAFSMLIQQQMQIAYNDMCSQKHVKTLSKEDEIQAVSDGWLEGLKIIQKIAANGRYFTESATKPIIDVASGNCLAGIAVDFYGFAEIKHLEERSGSKRFKIIFPGAGDDGQDEHDDSKRFKFIFPQGGGAPSPDPIAVFRGAKRPDLAKIFIEYILSEGQKLLDFKTNTPGGPIRTTMRRTPILKTIYNKEFEQYRVDPTVNPYKSAATFVSHDEWTDPVFAISGTLIKLAFIDNNVELVRAWEAILNAKKEERTKDAETAEKIMTDLSQLDYLTVINTLVPTFSTKDVINILHIQNKLSDYFRQRYILAKSIAKGNECSSK